jgi:transposase InsO family protein
LHIILPAPIDKRYQPQRIAAKRELLEQHIIAGGHSVIKRLAREFGMNPTTVRRIVRRIQADHKQAASTE